MMYTCFTIVRYPKWLGWAGFLSMALFHFPLLVNKSVSFYKLMGSGKNGSFSKVPDLHQWALLAVINLKAAPAQLANAGEIYGSFITQWWKFFRCAQWTVLLQPMEGHGTWDGREVFGPFPPAVDFDGPIAVLTRATIRISKLPDFWKHTDAVAKQMSSSRGLITAFGIGEVPWLKQATFSVWQDKESMKAFAGALQHVDVIRKTRQQKWYSEDMYVRFRILQMTGTTGFIPACRDVDIP